MSDEELMQVAVAISAIGLVGIEETEEVAIELTALAKLGARFPDLSLIDLNRALALAVEDDTPTSKRFDA